MRARHSPAASFVFCVCAWPAPAPATEATTPAELTLSVRALACARRWQELPQRRRNTHFIFEVQNAIKPYNGNDGRPPGRRDLTEVRCPLTESEPLMPGRSYLLRPGAAGPTWAATTEPQSSRPILLSVAPCQGRPGTGAFFAGSRVS